MNVCAIIVSNVHHIYLSLKQRKMLMLNNQKLYPLCCRVLDISPPSDVYEQYKWLQVPSGYFCFQLIRETAFAIKKEIVFFN